MKYQVIYCDPPWDYKGQTQHAGKASSDTGSAIKHYPTMKLKELKEEFGKKLKGKCNGTEVALSLASGDGKEHMALISALINLPVGIRFAALTKEGIIDL